MRSPNAIIVGGDQSVRGEIHRFLKERCGLAAVSRVEGGRGGLDYLHQRRFDLVLVDREALGTSERALIRAASRPEDRVPIVIVTVLAKLAVFVRQLAEQSRPETDDEDLPRFDNAALGQLVSYARDRGEIARAPSSERAAGQPEPAGADSQARASLFERMGRSEAVERIVEQVEEVARTDYSVMLVGETGVGKELVARAIHAASHRAGAEMVAVDCGAISESLAESELFGHVEGAFTGAEESRPGKFRIADGGTLFLDEISTMSASIQGMLLRVLEQQSFYPVGGSREFEVDCRVIAASNRAVRGLDQFRDDLYYRLAEYVIELPPLRERKEDIPHLARRFLREAADDLPGPAVVDLSSDALSKLEAHAWPGNVRELRNAVRRAALRADERGVRAGNLDLGREPSPAASLPDEFAEELEGSPELTDDVSLTDVVQSQKEEIERQIIARTMERADGNMAETARRLNADYKTIYTKVREYGLMSDDD